MTKMIPFSDEELKTVIESLTVYQKDYAINFVSRKIISAVIDKLQKIVNDG